MLKYHIQTIDVGSGGAADITFNSIPDQYDDLVVMVSSRSSRSFTSGDISLNLNGSASNFTGRFLQGNGSSAGSLTTTTRVGATSGNTATANTFGNATIYIANYRSSANKSISTDSVSEHNATTIYQAIDANLWSVTDAITSITLQIDAGAGNFMQYSSASLYGIKRGSSGEVEVASGGAISFSGGYTYHTFQSSGTFVANRNLNAEVLVVAGGGGGADNTGPGGGAGGYLASMLSLSSGQSYLATVGAGGAGSIFVGGANTQAATRGGASSFGSLGSLGGGATFSNAFPNGGAGGSGSGGYGSGTGGAGTAGQGNPGGAGAIYSNPAFGSGGGGGAGAPGEAAQSVSPYKGGDGGAGLQWLNGSYYAGGGGAGADSGRGFAPGVGGIGGGGGGGSASPTNGTPGTANTGGGGGGGSNSGGTDRGDGAAGGSGIVIIRYLTPAQ